MPFAPASTGLYISELINGALRFPLFPQGGDFRQPELFVSAFVSFLERVFLFIPWPVWVLLAAFAGWALFRKWYVPLLFSLSMLVVIYCGMWPISMLTLAIVAGALLISMLLGGLCGLMMSASARLRSVIDPALDNLGAVPPILYLALSALLFGPGSVTALCATTLCTVPTFARSVSAAIRSTSDELRDAGRAMGASKWQSLFLIEIPQALPTLVRCVRSAVIMAVSMVTICSVLGGPGLGSALLTALMDSNPGTAIEAGFAIGCMAVILERICFALGQRVSRRA